ncbi:hypothetical protein RP20_CCG010330 [Aedes albopictus]|nr:hypothetical protein RP20_CCG010330 [Aedes albopictus]
MTEDVTRELLKGRSNDNASALVKFLEACHKQIKSLANYYALCCLHFRVVAARMWGPISTTVSPTLLSSLRFPAGGRRWSVSWFRRKDYQLLTVGLSTYSSDDRFLVEHTRHLGNWALRIKNARREDEGLYECQISTHPPQSIFIELRIVEAVAEILEAPDLHIDEGSTLRLECKLKRATESPLYVFWYHEERMVNYDQQDGISVSTNKLTSSVLTVRNATARHGGNYTCAPANARQSSIYVHVLKGRPTALIDSLVQVGSAYIHRG